MGVSGREYGVYWQSVGKPLWDTVSYLGCNRK